MDHIYVRMMGCFTQGPRGPGARMAGGRRVAGGRVAGGRRAGDGRRKHRNTHRNNNMGQDHTSYLIR